ncbi:MAG: TIGR02281 family clan AA aspartic protease [Emcibacter sp.]|nr:TIGR02281 family clan AA aspartic protease [Emcibacter sp.]
MISPIKILLYALCVAGGVAYYGDRLVEIAGTAGVSQRQAASEYRDEESYRDDDYGGDIHVAMNRDGHYWVTLEVNGTPTRFVVDTGASHISLSFEAAEAAGLDPAGLTYDRAFRTANGISYKAMVKLDQISLDSIEISDISASVSQQGHMGVSLLGMNFLNKLASFKMEDRNLILTP